MEVILVTRPGAKSLKFFHFPKHYHIVLVYIGGAGKWRVHLRVHIERSLEADRLNQFPGSRLDQDLERTTCVLDTKAISTTA